VAGVSLMLAWWYKLTLLMFVRLQKPASPSLYFEKFTHRQKRSRKERGSKDSSL